MNEADDVPGLRVILLAAEGMAEAENEPWIRDAMESEMEAFRERHNLARDELRELMVDETGRPYWIVTIADDAPDQAERKAARYAMLRSLLE